MKRLTLLLALLPLSFGGCLSIKTEPIEVKPIHITVDVNVKRPARILLNTGYDKGWRTDVGKPGEQNKQLIVDLPPGRHRVHVKYWPATLTAGFVLTALGIVGSVLFLGWESSRRRKAG